MALVLLFGAMAAWALTEYRFRGSTALALFLSIGIMVPIRLGSVAILNMMRSAGLNDTLTALILIYVVFAILLNSVGTVILQSIATFGIDTLFHGDRVEGAVDVREHVPRRHDVEERDPRDRRWVVETHPVGDPRAAVVAGDGEPFEAERRHRLDLVRRLRLGQGARPIQPCGLLHYVRDS